MSGELPSPWGQAHPRCVRLAPNGLLVPAATLRILLRDGRTQQLAYTGHALEPSVRDGETVRVSSALTPRRGDLLLYDFDGWGDLLRCVGRSADGAWHLALDAVPARRVTVTPDRVLGVVLTPRWDLARLMAAGGLFPLRRPVAALRHAWCRVLRAPDVVEGPAADESVMEKYRQQVSSYRSLRRSALTEELVLLLGRHLSAGGTILVGGCGAGNEAIHLARLGYRVSAFDAVPGMVEAAGEAGRAAGAPVEFAVAELATLDLAGRRFDAIYLTPLLYSMLCARNRRIAVLRRLARHLGPGGCLLFSAQPYRGAAERLLTALAVARRRLRGSRVVEPGDWYTWFLTPHGTLGYSYLHRFGRGELETEVETAGLLVLARVGTHVLAGLPTPSMAGPKPSS